MPKHNHHIPTRLALDIATESISSGWILLKAKILTNGAEIEAKLIPATQHQSHEIDLPVSLKGNLVELVQLPADTKQLWIQVSGKSDNVQITELTLKKVRLPERIIRRWIRIIPIIHKQPRLRLYRAGFRWYTVIFQPLKAYELSGGFRAFHPKIPYKKWMQRFDRLSAWNLFRITRTINKWKNSLTLSIIYPGKTPSEIFYSSLDKQLYKHFIHLNYSDWQNSESKKGWAIFTQQNVRLQTYALFYLANEIHSHPDCMLLYSDHDQLNEQGNRVNPFFKPQWSPEFLLAHNYLGGLLAVNTDLLPEEVWNSHPKSIYEIALACLPYTAPYKHNGHKVLRIPAVLYHQQQPSPEEQVNDTEALHQFLKNHEISAQVTPHPQGFNQVIYTPVGKPLVSIIVPTRDALHHLKLCVESVLSQTTYTHYELLIIDNQSEDPETLAYFETISQQDHIRVIPYPHPFNYSAINNIAAQHARGDLLCLLNNDTEVITPEWLEVMIGQLQQPNVGVVGIKLLFDDRTVQHAGDAVGPGGCADHYFSHYEEDEPGYMGRAIMAQDLSAVTAACMLTHTSLYRELGGLDEQNLAVAFNDVDYCLRVREAGRRVVFTPYAKMFHHESVSRGKDDSPEKKARSKREADYMRRRWQHVMDDDPYYNPNLNYTRPDFNLSHAPMVDKPWLK
ncbi:glycosyltransferase family 2 protein [Gynuella sp.]|uniref:glycosyltransferase family 2 protein n=1 Tax=Gynuella sp. TaxID=2969146 RepID=UPI003D10B8F0